MLLLSFTDQHQAAHLIELLEWPHTRIVRPRKKGVCTFGVISTSPIRQVGLSASCVYDHSRLEPFLTKRKADISALAQKFLNCLTEFPFMSQSGSSVFFLHAITLHKRITRMRVWGNHTDSWAMRNPQQKR